MTPPPFDDPPQRRRSPTFDDLEELRAQIEKVEEVHEEWQGRWLALDGRIEALEESVDRRLAKLEASVEAGGAKLDKLLHAFALDRPTKKSEPPEPGGAIIDAIERQKLGGKHRGLVVFAAVVVAYALERFVLRLTGGP